MNPFDEESPVEKALRAFHDGPFARTREEIGRSAGLFAAEQTKALVQWPDLVSFGLPKNTAQAWLEADRRVMATLSPLREALGDVTSAVQALSSVKQSFAGTYGKQVASQLQAYEQTMRALQEPLKGVAEQLARHQQALADALGTVDLGHWAEFGKVAGALAAHYRAAEAAGFAVDGGPSMSAMALALEEVEPTAAPDPTAVAMLVHALVALVGALAKNTTKRVSELDIIEILLILATIKSLSPDYTVTDRHRDGNTAEIVQRTEDTVKQVAATRAAEHAYLESLPRVRVAGLGRIREAPTVGSRNGNTLERGAVVAIAEKRGRWRRIIFHDPSTGELAEGWIWSGSLEQPN